ncbi:hypothetical protein BOTBODRAFT_37756 [Botryobasidium botryosum FD-172 SS1]|uniref:Uncharacterized protein n=1 Tax=Botryobasidium botryosum (strain FD-172 SS1) TaxID=930990 RepID=A0A067LYU8_BOTB1|nr:hypothetical protein BOTBODRAFT_37756 [Botryobasidium botryosum FD-172 SS1]
MSLPRSQYDPRRVCVIPFNFESIPIFRKKRSLGVYVSGLLFGLAHWIFLDAAVLSAHAHPPPDAPYDTVPIHITFLDWIPGICSTLGLLIVNLVNKEQLIGEGGSFGSGEGGFVWRVRLFLFFGFALMAGGLAGSVCVLVLKYIVPQFDDYLYYGYANVAQNVLVMLSAIVLWIAQNTHDDDEYNYQLTL